MLSQRKQREGAVPPQAPDAEDFAELTEEEAANLQFWREKAEAGERQRQAQHAKSWEGQRDTRIQSWRAFTQRQDRRSSVATRGGGGGGGGGGGSASSRREPSAGQSSLDADGPRRGSRPSSGPPSGPPSAPASGARASPPLNPRSRPGGPMATPPAKKRQRPSSIPLLG
ncbi:hypothetical protein CAUPRSCDRAFT_13017 [Caulochytrium protostelioides]|uniref:Uncharacterized protein n=1 Tax=Caulochytrium protostelioides TaxID=1555241 RepID=A0A4P9WV47_9FUNG|nr:hypothetical protein CAUPRSCDRAFT_13017 [Caulochytrium protostelioides]